MNNRKQSSVSGGRIYRVFVILAVHGSLTKSQAHDYCSVYVGQCEGPTSASLLVQKALSKGTVADPKFVLLVPNSQIEAPA